jgi:hypothetical protein
MQMIVESSPESTEGMNFTKPVSTKEENEIAKNAEKTYNYVVKAIKAPWPRGEEAIVKDLGVKGNQKGLFAFLYAQVVLNKPWKEHTNKNIGDLGEQLVLNSNYKNEYKKHFKEKGYDYK